MSHIQSDLRNFLNDIHGCVGLLQTYEHHQIEDFRKADKEELRFEQVERELEAQKKIVKSEAKKCSILKSSYKIGSYEWFEHIIVVYGSTKAKLLAAAYPEMNRLQEEFDELKGRQGKNLKYLIADVRKLEHALRRIKHFFRALPEMGLSDQGLTPSADSLHEESVQLGELLEILREELHGDDAVEYLQEIHQRFAIIVGAESQFYRDLQAFVETIPAEHQLSSLFHGFRIQVSLRADSALSEHSLFFEFKKKFPDIIRFGRHVISGEGNQRWRRVMPRVIRGELPDGLRIFFWVENNELHIFDITTHGLTYRRISNAIAEGRYAIPLVSPFEAFLESEAA